MSDFFFKPMLAKLSDSLPANQDRWGFEYKWDGVRALLYSDLGKARLIGRNGNDITFHYPELRTLGELSGAGLIVLDGEIVAVDEKGRPNFGLLQKRMHLSRERALKAAIESPVQYYAFDLLIEEGNPILDVPYSKRREKLEAFNLNSGLIRTPPSKPKHGSEMLRIAQELGLEGIVCKRLDSPYCPGLRTSEWIKIKIVKSQEFVVGGWTNESARSRRIGALLLGYFEDGKFRYAGRVGTGFDAEAHKLLASKLSPIRTENSQFMDEIRAANVQFVSPRLVAEVEFRRWPRGGLVQQASYKGLRNDKRPRQIKRIQN